jgi:hypothetical protein
VVFVRGPDGKRKVWVRELSSATEFPVTSGDSDDIHPDFLPDCSRIVYASRSVRQYDLYLVDVRANATPELLTDREGNKTQPRVSPIAYTLRGVRPEACGGPMDETLAKYHKVLYSHESKGRTSVRFVSSLGHIDGQLENDCQEASWTSDGLGMLLRCGKSLRLARVRQLTPASAIEAAGGAAKVERIAEGIGSEQESYEELSESPDAPKAGLLKKLLQDRRRTKLLLALESPLAVASAVGLSQVVPSANGAAVLAVVNMRSGDKLVAVPMVGPLAGNRVPIPHEGNTGWPSWSPDGSFVLFSCGTDLQPHICRVVSSCPLQETTDLAAYPELVRDGFPDSLARNGFMARPSGEKEFFHLYEKLRYEDSGVLVTPDAMLQMFSDTVSRQIQGREVTLARQLNEWARRSLEHVVSQGKDKVPWSPSRIHLAMAFAVPQVLLSAAMNLPQPEMGEWFEPPEEDEPSAAPGREDPFPALLEVEILRLPGALQPRVRRVLDLMKQESMVELQAGDAGAYRKLWLDFSMMKPRGHYVSPVYQQYFQAMQWLSLWPLPVDVDLVGYAAWMKTEAPDCLQIWDRISVFAGALAGPPAVPGLELLLDGLKEGGASRSVESLQDRVRRFPVLVRTLEDALEKQRLPEVMIFPKRLGPDAEIFKKLTHPDVDMRGWPSLTDVLAALGLERVLALTVVPSGEQWKGEAWRKAVDGIRGDFASRPKSFWKANLYNRWLALLGDLPKPVSWSGRVPKFVASKAWTLRLIMASMAGLTQLKHHTVLYSFSNYGVECDGYSPIVILYEQPVKRRPAVYVEPHPTFYRDLAALAAEAGALFGQEVQPLGSAPEGCEQPFGVGCHYAWDHEGPDCPSTCSSERFSHRSPLQILAWTAEVCHSIVEKQRSGPPLEDWEHEVLNKFGAIMEELFLNRPKWDVGMTGADQGRQERGVTLVTDVYTNVQRNLVLHEGIGRPFRMVAVVPFDGSDRVVQGAMQSWYEFTYPSRMTDEEWWELLSKAPDKVRSWLPSWVWEFLE